MQRDIKIAVIFILTVVALVGASYYSFRVGYRVSKEIWRNGGMIVVPSSRTAI